MDRIRSAARDRPPAVLLALGAAAAAAGYATYRLLSRGSSEPDTGLYDKWHRELQDRNDTRRLADLLERMARTEFSPDDRAFVESVPMFFLATVDSRGMPTVSFKGGAPGFVRATGKSELCFPLYDGNGMQLTLGNIAATKKVGLLFVDFGKPRRLRAQGIARHSQDPALLSMFPGAQYVCVVEVKHLYVNCGRYIAKGHLEVSPHVPNAEGKQPLAGWKRLDVIGPVLSERDKKKVEQAGGYIGIDKYTGEDEPDMATLAVQ